MNPAIPHPFMTFVPATRGRTFAAHVGALGVFRLPSDPTGVFTLRLKNLVVGSRVRIETVAEGHELAAFVATAADHDCALDLYASGSPFNDLRIKVRKASDAPTYRPFESQAVAQAGVVTVYVLQESDE